jgi:hypothetical protein
VLFGVAANCILNVSVPAVDGPAKVYDKTLWGASVFEMSGNPKLKEDMFVLPRTSL